MQHTHAKHASKRGISPLLLCCSLPPSRGLNLKGEALTAQPSCFFDGFPISSQYAIIQHYVVLPTYVLHFPHLSTTMVGRSDSSKQASLAKDRRLLAACAVFSDPSSHRQTNCKHRPSQGKYRIRSSSMPAGQSTWLLPMIRAVDAFATAGIFMQQPIKMPTQALSNGTGLRIADIRAKRALFCVLWTTLA